MSEELGVSPVIVALLNVKRDVGAISKDRSAQGYKFRGIDDVINATHQAMLDHRVLVIPAKVVDYKYDTVTTDKGKSMGHIRIVIEFMAVHESGNSVQLVGAGEAFDAGDKSTPKASSVAMRTAMLQALALPTAIEDIEESNDVRGPAVDPVYEAHTRLAAAAKALGLSKDDVEQDWQLAYPGQGSIWTTSQVDKLLETAEVYELKAKK